MEMAEEAYRQEKPKFKIKKKKLTFN